MGSSQKRMDLRVVADQHGFIGSSQKRTGHRGIVEEDESSGHRRRGLQAAGTSEVIGDLRRRGRRDLQGHLGSSGFVEEDHRGYRRRLQGSTRDFGI